MPTLELTVRLRACGCAVSRLPVEIVLETAIKPSTSESSKTVIVVVVSVESESVVESGEIDARSKTVSSIAQIGGTRLG